MPDLTKLNFFSRYPIDKIVQQGEITIVNDGDTRSGSGTNTGPETAKIVTGSQANNYGKTCLARARWSTDGGSNWQALEAELVYTFTITYTDIPVTSDPLQGLDSAISVGTTTSQVQFRTANGRHGNVSTTSGNPFAGYTPTSKTFIIQYVLYEKD